MSDAGIPEIIRPPEGRLEVRIPWREGGNRSLIKSVCGTRTRPEWDARRRCWLVARPYFQALIRALSDQFGKVAVITWHCQTQTCDIRCQEATGYECVCSCGGAYHGGDGSYTRDWRLVSSTTLVGTVWAKHTWIAPRGSVTGPGRTAPPSELAQLIPHPRQEEPPMNAAEMHAYVTRGAERLTGPQLPVYGAAEIFEGFVARFGPADATRIARAAIEVHHGMWRGAPITPRRFQAGQDEFFARPVLAGVDGQGQGDAQAA